MSSPAQIFASDLAKLSDEVHDLGCRTEEMGDDLPAYGPARRQMSKAAGLLYEAAKLIEALEPDEDDRGDVEYERRRDEGRRL